MTVQPHGLLNSGIVTVKIKEMLEFEIITQIKFYNRPYFENKYPIFYDSIRHNLFVKQELTDVCSIYHLFSKGELVYVGITKNTWQRLYEHNRKRPDDWDAFVIFPTAEMTGAYVREIESKIIQRYNPKLNRQWKDGVYNHHKTF